MATMTTAFWHPFADMGAVSRRQLTIERGEGVWVWDSEDNRYLDATASLWYANIGHARPEVADAVSEQMRRLEAYSTFGDFGNRPADELCAALAARAPMEDARIFLSSGRASAVHFVTVPVTSRSANSVTESAFVHSPTHPSVNVLSS